MDWNVSRLKSCILNWKWPNGMLEIIIQKSQNQFAVNPVPWEKLRILR